MAKHHPDLVMCRKQPGVALGDSAKNVMATVSFAIPLSTRTHLFTFVRNATTGVWKAVASFAQGLELQMRTTAENASNKKRTGTVVQRLLIWGVRKQICFMNAKSMVSKRGDDGRRRSFEDMTLWGLNILRKDRFQLVW
eukprot:CAMPEP_0194037078 /NCGR_PEP_ID=MMETSP0009_2-20130614/9427_1 /TAXON_ID=210454 /ORGANISM="Grammatophora oceanica, Strain CCMP 410" /LENGTH=138 /DNA_ID=CAMNT_0038679085 /DNA_START=78 /DNA_END=492 /DNA_ORIENTATION=-